MHGATINTTAIVSLWHQHLYHGLEEIYVNCLWSEGKHLLFADVCNQ